MKQFNSFASFAVHLATLIPEVLIAQHEALVEGCKILQKQAKSELGSYQGEAGPFVAWAELADSTKADRLAQGYSENEPGVRSGEMRDSIEYKAGTIEAVVGSDDDKLVWFEEGTVKQPPRSVLGLAGAIKGPEVAEVVGGAVYLTLCGEKGVRAVAHRTLEEY